MEHAFEIGESLKFGWAKFKAHNGVLLGSAVVILAINFLQGQASDSSTPYSFTFLDFALLVVSAIVNIGFTIMGLKIARGEKVILRDLIPPAKLGWDIFLASTLAGIIIFGGFVLLIIPGIYLWVRLSMVSYAVIDGAGLKESLKKSGALTRGHEWRLLGLGLIFALLFILGAIPLMLGLLVAMPVINIAFAHVYEKLKHAHGHHHGHTAQ